MKKAVNAAGALAKQIQEGYVVEEETGEGVKRYRTRTLKEVLEQKITSKQMTPKAVLDQLQKMASGTGGKREKARAEGLIPYFKNFSAKTSKEVPAEG